MFCYSVSFGGRRRFPRANSIFASHGSIGTKIATRRAYLNQRMRHATDNRGIYLLLNLQKVQLGND